MNRRLLAQLDRIEAAQAVVARELAVLRSLLAGDEPEVAEADLVEVMTDALFQHCREAGIEVLLGHVRAQGAAVLLGCSESTPRRWRDEGGGPRSRKYLGKIEYALGEI